MNLLNKNTQGLQNRIDNALIFKNQAEENLFETEKIQLDFINELRHYMEVQGLTKTDLAKILNTSKSYITQLFSGNKLINLKTLGLLQKKLDVKFKIHLNFEGTSLSDKVVDEYNKENFPNIQLLLKHANENEVSDLESELLYPKNRIIDEDYNTLEKNYSSVKGLKQQIIQNARKEL